MKLKLLLLVPFFVTASAYAAPCVSGDARNCYEILGVPKFATKEQSKSPFRKLAMQYHPDRNPGNDLAEKEFKKINAAWEIIKDDAKKAAYDFELRRSQDAPGAAAPAWNFQSTFTTQQFNDSLRPVVNLLRDILFKREIDEQAAKWNSYLGSRNQAAEHIAGLFQQFYTGDPDSLMKLIVENLPNDKTYELVVRAAAMYWLIKSPEQGRNQFITFRTTIDIFKRLLESIRGTVLGNIISDQTIQTQIKRSKRILAQLDYVETLSSNPGMLRRIGAACEVYLKTF